MKTIRILIGGSPCTHWSIAQSKNRETDASGIGWELFRNYLIAREKFNPHYFLYENNKSAAEPIKRQIAKELNVWDGTTLMPYNDNRFTYINSALVSAQNRERFYVTGGMGDISRPEDRGILLCDVLDSGMPYDEKAYCLTARYSGATVEHDYPKHQKSMVAEPVQIGEIADGGIYRNGKQASQQSRVYSPCGKSVCVDTDSRKFVAVPIEYKPLAGCDVIINDDGIRCAYNDKRYRGGGTAQGYHVGFTNRKSQTLMAGHAAKMKIIEPATPQVLGMIDGKKIYEVRNGLITINGEQHPIKLLDGFYIIRKLTVAECSRLQTIPDWYVFPVSNSQAYKMLGNGWTVEVIKHILRHIPEIRNGEDCEFEVLSMYDGMAGGAIALTELGVKIKRYVAYEIDKFAIQTACANFPFIEHRGDAFRIRDNDWTYGTDIPAGTMTDAAVWKY